ncbi:MAG: GlsB/YeaQ/YmgE family stress response membrane protein [Bacteroidota bacterium]
MDSLWSFIITVLFGALAGYIASQLMKEGFGFLVNAVLGIFGSILGGQIFLYAGIQANSIVGQLASAVLGAVLIIWVVNKLKK